MIFKNLKELADHQEKIISEIETLELQVYSKKSYLEFVEKNKEFMLNHDVEPDEPEEQEWAHPFSLRGLIQPGLNVINSKISL
jgi:hypothetical protein